MVEIAGFRVGAVELARIPYFDIALDPAVAQLTAEQVAAVDWATPAWATDAGQVLIGQAVWVVVSREQLIVVDPCAASDQFLRTGPEAITHQEAVFTAMRDAGFPPERVDVVVLSHLDGIGMTAVVDPEGRWAPAFPHARVVMMQAELDFLAGGGPAQGVEALDALIAAGYVDGVGDGHCITDEVRLELVGGHTPGSAVIRIESDGARAAFLGHLLLSPVNLAMDDIAALHPDGTRAVAALDALVAEAQADGSLLIGPLWPYPGAGYVTADGAVVAAD